MANTFKRATKSSLLTTDVTSDSATTILTATGASTLIIIGMASSNKTATSATVNIYLKTASGDSTFLIKNAPVPAGSTFEYCAGNKIIVGTGDSIRASSNTATAIDLTISYLEQS
jgi:hypothetical protein